MRSNYVFLGSLDTLSSNLLKFLCVKDRKPGEGPRLPPLLSQKKIINGFARFTKIGREDVGEGTCPLTDIKLIKVGFICAAVTKELVHISFNVLLFQT